MYFGIGSRDPVREQYEQQRERFEREEERSTEELLDLIGERQQTLAALVPCVLFGLAGYLYYVEDVGSAVGLWAFWGLLALVFAVVGPAHPIQEQPLDTKRKLVGAFTLVLGLLCFTPVPIQILM
jgi:hypothetical protein